MSHDLREQIREVVVLIEDSQAPILGADVRAGSVGRSTPSDEARLPMRRVTTVAVAFAVVMILVGGVAWLAPFGDGGTPADGSTVTTSTTLSGTPPLPMGDGPRLEFVQVEFPTDRWVGTEGVSFKGNLYIASVRGELFRTPNGVNWETLPNLPGVTSFTGLQADQPRLRTDGEVLVYVAAYNRVRDLSCDTRGAAIVLHTSTDGVSWVSSTIELPVSDPNTTWGCGNFELDLLDGVAVGSHGFMVTALDRRGARIVDGVKVAGIERVGHAWFSPDGTTWRHLDPVGPLDGGSISAVVATPDGFAATSGQRLVPSPSGSPPQHVLWETVDGTTWTNDMFMDGDNRLMTDGLDLWGGRLVSASTNGVWTIEDPPQELIPDDAADNVHVMRIGDFGLVGLHEESSGTGMNTEVLFSTDGSTWSRWTPPEFGRDGGVYLVGIGDDFVVLQLLQTRDALQTREITHWVGTLP